MKPCRTANTAASKTRSHSPLMSRNCPPNVHSKCPREMSVKCPRHVRQQNPLTSLLHVHKIPATRICSHSSLMSTECLQNAHDMSASKIRLHFSLMSPKCPRQMSAKCPRYVCQQNPLTPILHVHEIKHGQRHIRERK